jgi:hypothetical protein
MHSKLHRKGAGVSWPIQTDFHLHGRRRRSHPPDPPTHPTSPCPIHLTARPSCASANVASGYLPVSFRISPGKISNLFRLPYYASTYGKLNKTFRLRLLRHNIENCTKTFQPSFRKPFRDLPDTFRDAVFRTLWKTFRFSFRKPFRDLPDTFRDAVFSTHTLLFRRKTHSKQFPKDNIEIVWPGFI